MPTKNAPAEEQRQARRAEIGARIKAGRLAAGKSLQEVSSAARISEQQLRRIEAGKHETSLLTMDDIARCVNLDLADLAPRLTTEQEHADELWERAGLSKSLPGTASLDTAAKKQLLVSMHRWEPVPANPAVVTLPRSVRAAGLVDVLPNKAALRPVLASLPATTQLIRFLAMTGAQSFDGPEEVVDCLAAAAQRGTSIEFVMLAPTARRALAERAKEMVGDRERDAIGIQKKIESGLNLLQRKLVGVVPDHAAVFLCDECPRWRILIIDDKAYVTHYPPDRIGMRTPVFVYQADEERLSPYWVYLHAYAQARSRSRPLNGSATAKVVARQVYDDLAGQIAARRWPALPPGTQAPVVPGAIRDTGRGRQGQEA